MTTANAVRPKLVVADAAKAIELYTQALGAVVGDVYEHAGRVVFADLQVLGTTVTIKDSDEHDPVPQPGPILDVVTDDPDGLADRMVAAGAEVVFPVADQFYGARGGRVRDPFGVQWLFSTPASLSPEELARVMAEG